MLVILGAADVLTGLRNFHATHGLATDSSQDLLIPAGDGVENLLKYAFNMLGSGIGQGISLASPNTGTLGLHGFAGLPLGGAESGTGNF